MKTIKIYSRIGLTGVYLAASCIGGCAQHYSSPQEAAAKSCSSLGPRALSGALIGAAVGAGTGAAIGAAASRGNGKDAAYGALAGLVVGAVAGTLKGKQLDENDCTAAQLALQQVGNAPAGNNVTWSSPQTGSHGVYTPVSDTYTSPSGQVCRKIQASYYMKDRQPVQGDNGVICRTPDGDWVRQDTPA